ncbi:MAG: hypothetical protein ACE5DY_06600 [Mariprofundaceae bacterium]
MLLRPGEAHAIARQQLAYIERKAKGAMRHLHLRTRTLGLNSARVALAFINSSPFITNGIIGATRRPQLKSSRAVSTSSLIHHRLTVSILFTHNTPSPVREL